MFPIGHDCFLGVTLCGNVCPARTRPLGGAHFPLEGRERPCLASFQVKIANCGMEVRQARHVSGLTTRTRTIQWSHARRAVVPSLLPERCVAEPPHVTSCGRRGVAEPPHSALPTPFRLSFCLTRSASRWHAWTPVCVCTYQQRKRPVEWVSQELSLGAKPSQNVIRLD